MSARRVIPLRIVLGALGAATTVGLVVGVTASALNELSNRPNGATPEPWATATQPANGGKTPPATSRTSDASAGSGSTSGARKNSRSTSKAKKHKDTATADPAKTKPTKSRSPKPKRSEKHDKRSTSPEPGDTTESSSATTGAPVVANEAEAEPGL